MSSAFAVGGVALAWAMYRKGGPEKVPASLAGVYAMSLNKLYVDEAYNAAVVKPAETLSFLARAFDGFLDSLARLFSAIPRLVGGWVRPVQNGLVQFYALMSVALGLVVFLSFAVFRITR